MKLQTRSSSAARLVLLSLVMMIINLCSQHVALGETYNSNETDLFALLEIKRQISDDPYGVLSSWNQSVHHCRWQGVTCDARHQRVTTLNLRGKSLSGPLSPHIGNLSFLKSIELQENRLHGEIPQEIGNLVWLRHLNVSINTLSGHIPVNLSSCLELVNCSAKDNRFIGQVPKEVGSLVKLQHLSIANNNLTGNIPPSLGNLSSLSYISFYENNLEGHLPNELGMLINLDRFLVSENLLSGTFPHSLSNISTLTTISVTQNFFHGRLPADIGPNLQIMDMDDNQFNGGIPNSIANATKLKNLSVSRNRLTGQVPLSLGQLTNFRYLNIEKNLLGGNSAEDLSFISSLTNCSKLWMLACDENNLGGVLPKTIGNLSSQIQKLFLGSNKISGAIPRELGNLVNLYLLGLEGNLFSGTIPRNFGGFQFLQGLDLAENRLSGWIPSTIYNITSLYDLQLQENNLEGTIHPTLGSCLNLKTVRLSRNKLTGPIPATIFGQSFSPIVLDLSHNSLTGSLSIEVGKWTNLNAFNVSYNYLSGEIPRTLGDSSTLEYLNMEGNSFRGSIPSSLASLKGLLHLDLSQNQLTGQIPKDLESIIFLKYLNLSFNDLEGEIPSQGVFANASLISVAGNTKLCGGIAELDLHSCLDRKKTNRNILAIILVPMLLAVLLISAMFFLFYQRRATRKRLPTMPSWDKKFIKVSFHELQSATAGFSSEKLIGSGSFGSVYKARLAKHGDRIVAIKVLHLQKNGASKSFNSECKALGNIRHRNLVTLLTYCSSIDWRGQDFKALIYEFMENGSLDLWLHCELPERNLSLLQRLNIAIDVASAVHYLHNGTEVPIVHCDLKPSNILLDSDLTAHVGDFGLARLLLGTRGTTSEQGTSSSVAIKGSIGYLAPEYGSGDEPSTRGDVYSFGVLLLEMFTGRRPTDDIFVDGLDVHNYVGLNMPEEVKKIADPVLLSGENDQDVQKCLVSMFSIGLKCSAKSPNDRMGMNEVLRELHLVRDAFLRAETNICMGIK